MALQHTAVQPHRLPWGLELVGAAMIGAALLFGMLLVAGHSDLLPASSTASVNNNAALMSLSKAAPGYYNSEKTYVVNAAPMDNGTTFEWLAPSDVRAPTPAS